MQEAAEKFINAGISPYDERGQPRRWYNFSWREAVFGAERAFNPFYFLYVLLEMLSSLIRGAGSAVAALVIVTVNMCAVRVAALEAVMLFSPDAASVAAIYPFTWGCTALCLFLYYKSGRWIPKFCSEKF